MNQYHTNKNQHTSYTIADLLKGNDLEIVAASLLLLGKLKVESVEIYRNEPTISVNLVGQFQQPTSPKVDELTKFFEDNGDMTIDEVFESIKQRLNR